MFKVRVLNAVSADYRREHIESGYFDYEHISAVPEALKRLLSFRGVYVTVNPVNPGLLARAMNRLRPAGRNPTTADTDIVRRRWLLIDCDPRRASGVSSSNAVLPEKAERFLRSCEVFCEGFLGLQERAFESK